MEEMFETMKEVGYSWIKEIAYFIKSNLRNFANILKGVCPYLMYIAGQNIHRGDNPLKADDTIILPIVIFVLACFLSSWANKLGKGSDVPRPRKRFTEVDEDGEVSVENNRLQELILYIADVEDWLERKGML